MPTRPIFNVQEVIGPRTPAPPVWEAMVGCAVDRRVTDIHLLARKDACELFFRTDGEMRPQGGMSHEAAASLIDHVKRLAEIDTRDLTHPTEGRMRLAVGDRLIDLRIGCVATVHGQDMVVRLADRSMALLDITQLGMQEEQLRLLRDLLSRPNGLILVTGPTGSGKTTSLYAMLREMTGKGRKIITIEDTVECDLPGTSQIVVDPKAGVTFASLLTAVMRHDPDVIMVGQVDDEATAQAVVHAANTGHLVLAGMHSPRGSIAVESLLNLGVHPYFLSICLRGILAQVLVERLCDNCRQGLPETVAIIVEDELKRRLPPETEPQLYQGAGCDGCYGSGYAGRIGLFELYIPDDAIRDLILRRADAGEIDLAAAAAGYLSIEQAGKLAAITGLTTMEQIIDALPSV